MALTPRQVNAERKKKGLPPLNFALFRKVIKKLETNPEAYDQNYWGRKSESAPCGTAACIAGWAACLAGKVSVAALRRNPQSVKTKAAKSLGVDLHSEEKDLFAGAPGYSWPEPYRSQWARARGPKTQAKVAIRYLTHIIKTGRVTE